MATVVKITVREQKRLKSKLGLYGAKREIIDLKVSNYPALTRLIKTREAMDTTIASLSAYLGYDLELEQDKIPA